MKKISTLAVALIMGSLSFNSYGAPAAPNKTNQFAPVLKAFYEQVKTSDDFSEKEKAQLSSFKAKKIKKITSKYVMLTGYAQKNGKQVEFALHLTQENNTWKVVDWDDNWEAKDKYIDNPITRALFNFYEQVKTSDDFSEKEKAQLSSFKAKKTKKINNQYIMVLGHASKNGKQVEFALHVKMENNEWKVVDWDDNWEPKN